MYFIPHAWANIILHPGAMVKTYSVFFPEIESVWILSDCDLSVMTRNKSLRQPKHLLCLFLPLKLSVYNLGLTIYGIALNFSSL